MRSTPSQKTSNAVRLARLAWLALCVFIVYGSMGTWAFYQPGIWAPTMVSARDVALNVLLYVPFGTLGVISLRDGYPRYWLRLVLRVVLLALIFSAANEALQLYTIDRVASLTDILSAGAGSLAGGVAIGFLEPR
ncbi:MAG TPA: VanZ family protein [Vicinamibacterales bacterium]|nr:VanZ family protein [Vicinamibacterales bacterium]